MGNGGQHITQEPATVALFIEIGGILKKCVLNISLDSEMFELFCLLNIDSTIFELVEHLFKMKCLNNYSNNDCLNIIQT